MLGKVLKYEMRALARLFLPLLTGFLAVTLLCKFSFEAASARVVQADMLEVVSAIFFMLYVVYVIALFVMAAVFVIMHFYKTMVGNRGYLSHTLPVKTSTLINAKLLAAILWPLIALGVLMLSFVIFAMGHVTLGEIQRFFIDLNELFGMLVEELIESAGVLQLTVVSIELLLCMAGAILSGPLMIYASIAVGQLFLKHRVLWAVVIYFVAYTVIQIFTTVMFGMLSYSGTWSRWTPHMVLPLFVAANVVPAVVYYAVTNYIFTKKLNLE